MVKIDPTQPEPVKKIVDNQGIEIDKIYNPSVGKYDVVVTTGPSYMTKRQEALDAMGMILQSNPQLWSVAGDLFIMNMDWPGAQEMAKRFAKIIDPKIMADSDESPEMQQAKQQMEAMAQELNQLHEMMQNVGKSIEVQDMERKEFEAQIKAVDAETKRISAVQAGMTEQQIQDIAMGVVAAAMESNNLMADMPSREENMSMEMGDQMMQPPPEQMMPPQEQPMMPEEQMMPPPEQGMPQ